MVVGLPDRGVTLERTVILGAARTPFGRFGGALSPLGAPELGGAAIRDAIDRSGIEDADLQHSIFGIVVQAGVGQIPSRQANFNAGLPFSLTTETLNQVCASGLRSATLAETMIRAGDYDVILAGGMESMSNVPYLLPKARWGARMGDMAALDAMMHDGLLDAFEHVNMIRFGTEGARKFDISREEQDEWALRSHERAAAATDEGRLPEEIVGVKVPGKKGATNYVEADEPIRRDTTIEKLASLMPIDEGGTVTAGNAPGVTDGGGALALGHPVGASGARILTTLLYELRRRGGGKGLAAICSGGGQGEAVLVEV